jgi:hypothetical protein
MKSDEWGEPSVLAGIKVATGLVGRRIRLRVESSEIPGLEQGDHGVKTQEPLHTISSLEAAVLVQLLIVVVHKVSILIPDAH